MQIYAHRAGRGLAPENTLIACQTTLPLNVDFIDFDIGMTKDGEIVVTHDMCLNPATTRDLHGRFITDSIPIYSLTYEELKAFNVGQINPNTPYRSYFPNQRQVEHASIPLLREAIDFIRSRVGGQVNFQIEIKIDYPFTPPGKRVAQALFEILEETHLVEEVEVQSFDYQVLQMIQSLDSRLKTTYLTQKIENNFSLKKIKEMGGSCWGPFQMEVTQTHIAQAHALGLKVVPWGYPEEEGTEFNVSKMAQLLAWGVDGIITDRPDKLKNMLKAFL